MYVISILKWGDGNITKRTIDWGNKEAVRKFSAVAHGCLRSGGQVVTMAYPDKPEGVSPEAHEDRVGQNMAIALQEIADRTTRNTI
jgi:hypothetical protein